MSELFNELLDSLREVAEMENCSQAIKEIDYVKEHGLNESLLNEVYPNKGESKKDFISRFMSVTKDEYPDRKQRYAVALSYWERRNKKRNESKENVMKFKLVENINEAVEEKDTFDERFDKEFDKYVSTPLSIDEFNKVFEEMINFE